MTKEINPNPREPDKPSDKKKEEPKDSEFGKLSSSQKWLNALRYGLWDI